MLCDISGGIMYLLLEVLNPFLTDFDFRHDFPTFADTTSELKSQKWESVPDMRDVRFIRREFQRAFLAKKLCNFLAEPFGVPL